MQNTNLTKKEGEAVVQAQQEMYIALFGSVNALRNVSILLVGMSIFLAMLIPHQGWFPTSQSQGMTNFHRWLYDQYVIVSCLITPIFYVHFKQKRMNPLFCRKWNAYIRTYAEFNVKNAENFQDDAGASKWQERLTLYVGRSLLKNKWLQYVTFICLIVGSILIYSLVTPFVSTRGSSFWILTWWPINVFFIGVLYYVQIPLLIRLFSIEEIHMQTDKLSYSYQREENN